MRYTSRSAIEAYQACNQYRYLRYHYKGIGIDPVYKSIPLTTGSCVHKGVEFLALWLKKKGVKPIEDIEKVAPIEEAVASAISAYKEMVEESGLRGKGTQTSEQEDFTYREQLAITEALVRVWALRELPTLNRRYRVVEVEKEIAVPLMEDVIFESRADIVLQDRESKDIVPYSLKTTKAYTWWMENAYQDDLQSLLELWAVSKYLENRAEKYKEMVKSLQDSQEAGLLGPTALAQVLQALESKRLPTSPMAVRFCFLVKGKREAEKDKQAESGKTGFWKTTSSLIQGYRFFSPNGVTYAHSLYFPNPANVSGKGRLGKGWERFNVWEDQVFQEGIKKWIEMLDERDSEGRFSIQPDCGDILGQYVVTPAEVFRGRDEIRLAEAQIRFIEEEIGVKLQLLDSKIKDFKSDPFVIFNQNRQHCHYPDECEFMPICLGKSAYMAEPVQLEVREDPIGSGWYQKRVPHHKGELNGTK